MKIFSLFGLSKIEEKIEVNKESEKQKSVISEKLYEIKHSMIVRHRNSVFNRYCKNLRRRLKNDNFTILSSRCIGGIIYSRLGKQFLSPTINMWFYEKEFLKFVLNLDHYLKIEPVFIKTEHNFPVAKLDDISLYFLHYDSEEEAKEAWERRKKRINRDKLYLIFYDRDGLTDDDYKKIAEIKCKNKIVLTERDNPEYPFFKKIQRRNDKVYFDKDEYGVMTFERQWDYVEWLNE